MRILLCNDDGIHAQGLRTLARALEPLGEVFVVAPDGERSASGLSISLHRPLRVRQLEPRWWTLDGTPVDCVFLALAELLPAYPDLVVAGINHGCNLGEDVFDSGTVAAASEASFRRIPAIAASQDVYGMGRGAGSVRMEPDFGLAAEFVARLARRVHRDGLPPRTVLNVNFPGRPPTGVRVAALGERNYVGEVVRRTDPRGRAYYWIGGSDPANGDIPGSDINLLGEGFVTVTPIRLDVTAEDLMARAGGMADAAWGDGLEATLPAVEAPSADQ